jgi:serine protease Do
MEKPEGALVARVVANGPGERGGLKPNDVILSVNGQDLASSNNLPPLVGSSDPGEVLTLRVLRDRKDITLKIEVGKLDEHQTVATAAAEDDTPAKSNLGPLGLSVLSLTPEQRSQARVLSGGVMVIEVAEGPAMRAGIRAGDVLLQINGQEIDSPKRYADVANRMTPGATVPVLVQRRGAPLFLSMDVPVPTPAKP